MIDTSKCNVFTLLNPSKKLNNLIDCALFRNFLEFWSNCQEGRLLDGGKVFIEENWGQKYNFKG